MEFSAFRNIHGRFIEIRLFREPEVDNSDTDDKIVIVPTDENCYDIIFEDAFSKVKHRTTLDGDGVDTYLTSLFSLLRHDKDPYRGIQFQIPAFPSILYDIQDLGNKNVRRALHRLLPLLTEARAIATR